MITIEPKLSKAARKKLHIHKYFYKKVINEFYAWACGIEGCNHYIPTNMNFGSARGLESICWICNKQFTIKHQWQLEMTYPICWDCLTQESRQCQEQGH